MPLTYVTALTPNVLELVFLYRGKDCSIRRDFSGDSEALGRMVERLRTCIGRKLTEVGNLNIL